LSRGRTVLILTHRLTNIKQANRIMVLENGRIAEQGTYSELTAAGGAFHRMVNGM
ncbi:MAG: ABC transporter ATP-binding protein, partial [Deltaproteobacteria bacterium]|nr:ABC transporter ATP-binding protein [Deltaproteobacteria bacterium]